MHTVSYLSYGTHQYLLSDSKYMFMIFCLYSILHLILRHLVKYYFSFATFCLFWKRVARGSRNRVSHFRQHSSLYLHSRISICSYLFSSPWKYFAKFNGRGMRQFPPPLRLISRKARAVLFFSLSLGQSAGSRLSSFFMLG